jgi:hypothetical protein
MTKLEKTKAWLKRAVEWVKAYWYYLLAVVVFFVGLSFFRNGAMDDLYKSLMQKFQAHLNGHQEDLDAMEAARAQEQAHKAALEAKYQATMRQLEDNHRVAVEALDEKQEENIRNIIENTDGDPEKMAELVSQTFGLPVRTDGVQ